MSGEERKQVLQMLESGKITADQALSLFKELEQDSQTEDAFSGAPAAGTEAVNLSESGLAQTAARARELWQIPLWIGVAIMLFSAFGMYSALLSGGYGFWFFFLWIPFLLGVALIALAAWSRTARWLFVNVERPQGSDGPRRILVGFPLPLQLTAWFLRTFGDRIDGLRGTNVDEVIQALSMTDTMDAPLIVNVEEGARGEHVQVFIG